LVKRTMTYRERSLVKCVLTNLRFNESNAHRHNRNGYWSNVPPRVRAASATVGI
jgi:hypothetical protein